jgi:hypothetical protein
MAHQNRGDHLLEQRRSGQQVQWPAARDQLLVLGRQIGQQGDAERRPARLPRGRFSESIG